MNENWNECCLMPGPLHADECQSDEAWKQDELAERNTKRNSS